MSARKAIVDDVRRVEKSRKKKVHVIIERVYAINCEQRTWTTEIEQTELLIIVYLELFSSFHFNFYFCSFTRYTLRLSVHWINDMERGAWDDDNNNNTNLKT